MKRQKSISSNKKSKKKELVKKNDIRTSGYFDKVLKKHTVIIYFALFLAIGTIAFYKYISTEHLFFFNDIGSDSVNQNYPAQIHTSNLQREGVTNKWSFYKGMGNPYIINPPVELYSFLRTIENKIGISFIGGEYLIYSRFIHLFIYHFLLSGILFYFYLRTISINYFSSLIGALLVSFSGYMIIGSSWGFSDHIYKAVFLLYAFEQLYLKKRWYFFPFAVLFLSFNIFVFFLYSIFLLIYSIFRISYDNEKLKTWLVLSGQMILLGIIGVLMNFQNTFNSFNSMFNSPRVSGNASYSQYLTGGQEIVNQANIGATTILRTFSSDILGSGSHFKGWNNYLEAPLFYIGLLTLLVLPQVFIYLNKRSKIVFGSFLGFWMLTLIFPFLRHAMLGFTGDYFRYGFDFFIPFTFLFYAVYALNEMDKGFKINYKLLAGTLVVLVILLFFPYQSIKISAIDNQIRMMLVVFLSGYSGLLILFSIPKYKNYAQIGLILLVCIELSYSSYKSYEKRVPVTKKEFQKNKAGYADGTTKAVEYIKTTDKTLFYRSEKDYNSGSAEHSSLNDALAQGYYGTASYSSFNQLNYIRFLEETEVIKKGNEIQTRWAPGFRGYPLLQTFGNVKYHLSKSEDPQFKRFGFDSIATIDSVKILKNRYYLPFGYTYDKYISFTDFQNLSLFNKQIALLNGFVYEDDALTHFKSEHFKQLNTSDSTLFVGETGFNFQLYQSFTDSLREDTFAISSFKQDNIKGSITLSKPKLLFFTIPFDEGWKVKVNGKEEKLSRVNIGFTGISLPEGTHQLELYFMPEYHQLTSWISWNSTILFWLYLGYYLYKKRRKKRLATIE